jgi:hypothetical protein
MYFIGSEKENTRKPQRAKKRDSVKFGLIEELAEENIAKEQ